jgi:hypothetical protein
MKIFQTMKQPDVDQNFTDLYAKTDYIEGKLDSMGKRSPLSDLINIRPVVNSLVVINTQAIIHDMFPVHGPFRPFSYCKMKEINGIIVGGFPNDKSEEKLLDWTGSAYCTNETAGNDTSDLHLHMAFSEWNSAYRSGTLSKDLTKLQVNGILLIPEVLSTFVNGNKTMAPLWEPFIWNFLAAYTALEPDTPILFTTESAAEKFRLAVEGTKYVFTELIGDRAEREDGKAMAQMQRVIRDNGVRFFNFISLSTKPT